MKIIDSTQTRLTQITLPNASGISAQVLIGKQDGAENFCMRQFTIAPDGYTPKHSHDWEHEIFFHAGTGEVFFRDTWHSVKAGIAVFIPGDMLHQIRNTGTKPLIFICLIPAGPPEL